MAEFLQGAKKQENKRCWNLQVSSIQNDKTESLAQVRNGKSHEKKITAKRRKQEITKYTRTDKPDENPQITRKLLRTR